MGIGPGDCTSPAKSWPNENAVLACAEVGVGDTELNTSSEDMKKDRCELVGDWLRLDVGEGESAVEPPR